MEAITEQAEALSKTWRTVYDRLVPDPQPASPHLQFISIEQVNEVVSIVADWMSRVRAPKGFSPAFHLAKAVAATALANALSACTQLEAGSYNHFPAFVSYLSNVLSAIHGLIAYSDRDQSEEIVISLGAQLGQGLALIQTAQGELKKKMDLLEDAGRVADRIQSQAERAQKDADEYAKSLEDLKSVQSECAEIARAMKEEEEQTHELRENLKSLLAETEKLSRSMGEHCSAMREVERKTEAQSKLVSDLLPNAASAGLASAFAARVTQLSNTKLFWGVAFLVSVVGLAVMAGYIVEMKQNGGDELWTLILKRLPLAAPLIWLGWFSAIQYGNTIRVQEDYAFKEATSKAFAGYRDHMEHLASVKLEEAATAMELLSAKTIEILGSSPLRIYAKVERDVSPTQSIIDVMKARASARSGNGASEPKE